MENKNYKYSIHINQFACIENGLDLDIIDLAILDYIKDFYCSNKCVKIQTEEGIYFWVSHTKIINDMPLLRIKTKQGLIKRINNLIKANILEKHPNCDVHAKTLYKFGSNYDLLIFSQNPNVDKYQNEFTPLNESLPPPSTLVYPSPSTFVYPPLNESLGNNTIINNKELINNSINDKYIGANAFSHKKNDLPNSLEAENLEEKEKNCAKKEKEYGRKEFIADCVALGAEKQHILDWVRVRASKKAQPTKTALKSIIEECNKHDFPFSEAVRICAEQSWAGFKYQWYQNLINDGKAKKPAATFTKESIERQFDAIDRMFKK